MPSFRYDLLEFSEVAKAVKAGNLLMLNEALDKNEKFFIKCGIFLILEKLKIITYRWASIQQMAFKFFHTLRVIHQVTRREWLQHIFKYQSSASCWFIFGPFLQVLGTENTVDFSGILTWMVRVRRYENLPVVDVIKLYLEEIWKI